MPLSQEERRRRQWIDRNPENKCQRLGCGNTAKLNEGFCSLHLPDGLTEEEREAEERQDRINTLENKINDLPDTGPISEIRLILSEIVRLMS